MAPENFASSYEEELAWQVTEFQNVLTREQSMALSLEL